MKRWAFDFPMRLIAIIFLLTGFCFGCATTYSPVPKEAPPTVTTGAAPSKEIPQPTCSITPVMTPYYPPPEKMDLCGEVVPLHIQDVQERLDREFTLVVYNHAQVYLWLKRMERYFPWIEERLRYYGLPEDLKYVAIVESDLQPNACSPKGAAGPWQFMPSTGASYGLDQFGSCDRRYDFERSTESAFRLLSDLYRRHKNWALALAAYNCGDKRIYDEMREQQVSDYYHLKLPQETERYVFRVLAVKAVLSNPEQYGYSLPKGAGYQELKLDKVPITLSQSVSIQSAANAAGITYREFKRLNPEFRGEDIPAGFHELKFPQGSGTTFKQNFDAARAAATSAPSPQRPRSDEKAEKTTPSDTKPAIARPQVQAKQSGSNTHLVKKGETLYGIAQKYGTSIQVLRDINNLKGITVVPGQKLKIP